MKRFNIKIYLILSALFLVFQGCVSLKPYQMVYVNDPEMQMGISSTKAFESYVHSIREGSVTSEGKKASGGCGCN
jgi:hypothetical protein